MALTWRHDRSTISNANMQVLPAAERGEANPFHKKLYA
jgi:hypothetical protein